MTNSIAFEIALIKSGKNKKFLAEKLGISTMSLFRKLNNITEFKISEIVMLQRLLDLSNDERDYIFFNQDGDK